MAVINGTNLPNLLQGTVFADTINGLNGDDMIWGFDGSDLLSGGFGDDTISGGSGNDTLDGGAGEDFFYGGSGSDLVTYASAAAGFALNLVDSSLSTEDAAGDLFFSIERFQLGAFSDRMIASLRAETVLGGGGNDTIDGGSGNDSLQGDAGNDLLIGGAGADRLTGGAGIDTASYETATVAVTINLATGVHAGDALGDVFSGIERFQLGAFADRFTGGAGAETVLGAAGNDTLIGGAGNDSLQGDAGNDLLIGGAGADRLTGGVGIDTASYETATAAVTINLASGLRAGEAVGDVLSSIERYQLGAFADRMTGAAAADTILGGAGNDTLDGGAGNDNLQGEAGNDLLIGGAGADVLNGGAGVDLASYEAATAAITLNLISGPGAGDALGDMISNIEQFRLSAFADRMTGGAGAETVFGGAGSDTIDGGASNDSLQGDTGDDVLIGGAGADRLIGGDGFDFASYETAAAAVALNLLTGVHTGDALGDVINAIEGLRLSNHNDTVTLSTTLRLADGGTGDDALTGSSDTDTLLGGAGNDTLTGGAGGDILNGGDGNDVVIYTSGVLLNIRHPGDSTGEAANDQLIGIETVQFWSATEPNTYIGRDLIFSGSLPALNVEAHNGAIVTAIAGFGAERFLDMTVVDYRFMAEVSSNGIGLTTTDSGVFTGSLDAEGDTLINTTSLILGDANDVVQVLHGNFTVNLDAGDGADQVNLAGQGLIVNLRMGAGADNVFGSAAEADIDMGDGDDVVRLQPGLTGGNQAFVYGGNGSDDMTVSDFLNMGVDGGEGDDLISVTSLVYFSGVGVSGGLGDDTITGSSFGGVYSGQDGDDSLTIEVFVTTDNFVMIDGSLGNDTIVVNTSVPEPSFPTSATLVLGGEGRDSITGTTLKGFFDGGDGDDTISATCLSGFGVGELTVIGGLGADVLTVSGGFGSADGDPLPSLVVVQAGAGFDTLTGTAGTGRFFGGDDNDIMNITVELAPFGSVLIDGEAAGDVINVTTTTPNGLFLDDATTVRGGEGDDSITGSSYFALYEGGDGDDTISAICEAIVGGGLTVDGGIGDDVLTVQTVSFSAGIDVSGGEGADVISAIFAVGTCSGGAGDDVMTVTGTSPFDTIIVDGGDGADAITGFSQFADYQGGIGDDTISATCTATTGGSLTIDGGLGHDVLTASGTSGFSIIAVVGGEGDDSLSVSSFSTSIPQLSAIGGLGDDTITGSTFIGSYLGGDGNDTLTIVSLLVSAGFVAIDGGAGADTITVTESAPDSSNAPAHATQVVGGDGDDTITGDVTFGNYLGGGGDDIISATCNPAIGGGLTVDGGVGNDVLTAATNLFGVSPVVDLLGGEGNDTITLLGDFARAQFIFETSWGNDTVIGFRTANDALVFRGVGGLDSADDLLIGGGADADGVFTTVAFVSAFQNETVTIRGLDQANFGDVELIFG